MIARLETDRLLLRGPRRDDFPAVAALWASERSVHMGGPRDIVRAWDDFAAGFGLWTIEGIGSWSIEERETGRFAGLVGLNHPIDFPEEELGWVLMDGFEGRGIALEAARAVLDWTWRHTSLATLVSYIGPANVRSVRLAERLGAIADPAAARVDAGDVVMRHRRPARAAA